MKKNILIIINRMRGAGPARVVSNLSLSLSGEKYNKYIAIYDADNSAYDIKAEKVFDLKTKPTRFLIKRIINVYRRIKMIKKIKKEYDIEATISFLPNPNITNILTRVNDKIIISERSFMSKEHSGIHGLMYKILYKIFYNKADEIITVSKAAKLDLVHNFKINEKKIKVIYNFYDIEKIKRLSKEELPSQFEKIFNNPTIITIGRLSYQKGQWHLIRAFKKVKKTVPNAKLIILGEGDLLNYLTKLTNELGLNEDVHFLGFKNNPFKFAGRADLFVFPSLYEGFPNALAEAMACGLPIISSDCPSGPREILSSDNNINSKIITDVTFSDYGVLIPTCDGKLYNAKHPLTTEELMLAESIITLLLDRELQQKYKIAAKYRIKKFSKDNIIFDWEKLVD